MRFGEMRRKQFERFENYKTLMKNKQHWGKTLGIISCKILRDHSAYKKLFNKILELLGEQAFRDLVQERDWHLAFTGGTFDCLPRNVTNCPEYRGRLHCLAPSALGVIQIANLVVYGHLFGVAFFNHMEDLYADSPQNLCLRRICNYCDTPLFEDLSSIEHIFLRRQEEYPREYAKEYPREGGSESITEYPERRIAEYYGEDNFEDSVLDGELLEGQNRSDRSQETLAIVSHDDRKMTMLNFCLEHIDKLLSYRRIVSTGTTGTFLREQLRVALDVFGAKLNDPDVRAWGWDRSIDSAEKFLERKIQPLASGPKGGDVQVSSKVIDGTCHRVLFFQDPERAHPHQFDIRLMEKAIQDPETAALFATSARTARMIV